MSGGVLKPVSLQILRDACSSVLGKSKFIPGLEAGKTGYLVTENLATWSPAVMYKIENVPN